MSSANSPHRLDQAATGLEQLAVLARAQSWRAPGSPALPPTQAALLRMLQAAPEGLRAGRMAERLAISPASLSDSLRALEHKGWLRRESDPDDRRASRLHLTAEGQALARRLSAPDQGLAALMGELDDADVGALLRITQLMVRQAQQQGLATGFRTCLGCRFFQPYASGRDDLPHVCGFTRQPFGDPQLRMDCLEQEPAQEPELAASVLRFRQRHPPSAD